MDYFVHGLESSSHGQLHSLWIGAVRKMYDYRQPVNANTCLMAAYAACVWRETKVDPTVYYEAFIQESGLHLPAGASTVYNRYDCAYGQLMHRFPSGLALVKSLHESSNEPCFVQARTHFEVKILDTFENGYSELTNDPQAEVMISALHFNNLPNVHMVAIFKEHGDSHCFDPVYGERAFTEYVNLPSKGHCLVFYRRNNELS